MGVTKQYLRYTSGPLFGVVGSPKANIVFLDVRGVKGKYCAVGACEDVIVWDLRTGEKVPVHVYNLIILLYIQSDLY